MLGKLHWWLLGSIFIEKILFYYHKFLHFQSMNWNVHGRVIFINYTSVSADVHKPLLYLKKETEKSLYIKRGGRLILTNLLILVCKIPHYKLKCTNVKTCNVTKIWVFGDADSSFFLIGKSTRSSLLTTTKLSSMVRKTIIRK